MDATRFWLHSDLFARPDLAKFIPSRKRAMGFRAIVLHRIGA